MLAARRAAGPAKRDKRSCNFASIRSDTGFNHFTDFITRRVTCSPESPRL